MHLTTVVALELICKWYNDREFCVLESFARMQMQKKNDQERKSDFEKVNANFDFEMIAEIKVKNAFSECLHTISDTQIEKDESSDDVKAANSLTVDDDDAKNEKENDAVFERLHTISDTKISKADNFDDEKDEKLIKSANSDMMINRRIREKFVRIK